MEELRNILTAIAIIWLWVDVMRPMLFMTPIYIRGQKVGMQYRMKLFRVIDRKPIDCGICLSFWIGLTLMFCFNEILYLSLPLIYHSLRKII